MKTQNIEKKIEGPARHLAIGRLAFCCLALLFVCLNADSQTCSGLSITCQTLTGAATRPKVGWTNCLNGDTPSCPTWYLQFTSGIRDVSYGDLADAGVVFCDWAGYGSDSGSVQICDPNTLEDGDPDSSLCPDEDYSPLYTTTNANGGATIWDCDHGGTDFIESNGGWTFGDDESTPYDPILAAYDTITGPDFDPTVTIDPNTCSDVLTTLTGSDPFGYPYTYTSEDKYTSEQNTSDIKSKVVSYASSRQGANSWANGAATSTYALAADESSASATASKYRFLICGTDPKQKYTITWMIQTYNVDGTATSSPPPQIKKATGVQGQAGTWYYPSEGGTDVPTPTWPSGCPSGGSHSTTYTSPTIAPDPQ